MAFRKAEKKKAKLRLALTGASGSGKTYGALLIAQGLGGKIAMIDTENGSGDLYADKFDYDICTLKAPYKVEKYLQAIHEAEDAGYDIIIIDSLSHAWAGEGGLLDLQEQVAESSKSGNSYTAWRKITPLHNKLIEAMLTSKCHIIATMRTKTEYVQSKNDKGYTEIKKVGTAPIQREGMDYEFSLVFDLSPQHTATASKDRTKIFDGQVFKLSVDTGRTLRGWLESGITDLAQFKAEIWTKFMNFCNGDKEEAEKTLRILVNNKPSVEWNEDDVKTINEFIKNEEELLRKREELKATEENQDTNNSSETTEEDKQ